MSVNEEKLRIEAHLSCRAILMANLRKGKGLHPNLTSVAHYDGVEDGDWGFGLKINKKVSSGNKEQVIRMPPLFLIDSSFKTNKVDKYELQYIVNICLNKVHLDRQILSSKISPPGPITAEVFKGWLEYQKFWKIRTPSNLTRPYSSAIPRCSGKEVIKKEDWDEQNRYITFWGTLLCKCAVHRKMMREHSDPSFLGFMSKDELAKYLSHDKQSVARYDIKEIMREASPEPGF